MGWDGVGGYTRVHNFSADASAGINILAARMDAEIDDVASAFTRVWTRDGQNTPTTDIPMAGRRFVNVGAPTSVSNFMRAREFIENVPIFMQDSASSADRISVSSQYFTSVSANQAPVDGTKIMVRAGSNKSSAVLYLDGHSANIEYQDGNAAVGVMASGGIYEFTYSSVDTAWKINNPGGGRTVGNVLLYGNNAIPGTTNMTAAIQAAIDANDNVYVPEGTYLTDSLTLRAGVRIYGDGHSSILLQNTVTDGGYGTLFADSLAAGSQVADILIENLQVLGQVDTQLFSEQIHLIALHGVTRTTIRNCLIKGFRGDGINLGSGEEGGQERHNTNVKVVNCILDGVNNDNRCGVAVIDGDDVLIEGNTFVNCSRSTMPGPIDCEPDSSWGVIRNIRVIGNHFKACQGNVANVGFVLVSATFTTQPESFVIEGNTFDGTLPGFVVSNNATTYTRPLNVVFRGNSGKVGDLWQTTAYVDGVVIEGNTLWHTGTAQFGTSAAHIAKNVVVANNVFKGDAAINGITLASGNAINIHDNVFDGYSSFALRLGDTGATLNEVKISDNQFTAGVPIGVTFNGGTVTNVTVIDNDASQVGTSVFSGSIPADTRIRGNKGYVSENGGTSGSISTGGTIAHGLAAVPTVFIALPTTTGATDVSVAADATNITVTFGGGGSHAFSWYAAIAASFAS